jgi:ABC-type dipeptide/oligopeptide/nickel transport system ATPase component
VRNFTPQRSDYLTDSAVQFVSGIHTHDLAATRYLSHRVAVMYKGEIVEDAPSETFYGIPDHPYSRALMSAIA